VGEGNPLPNLLALKKSKEIRVREADTDGQVSLSKCLDSRVIVTYRLFGPHHFSQKSGAG